MKMDEMVTINGTKIHYIDIGKTDSSKVVTFVHGFPFSHEMWKPQIEMLKDRYRIIAYDIRGHGRSEVGDGQYTLELFVDDLMSLLDYLGIQRTIVCGLSMGGYISLRAVEREPNRFQAVILCDTQASDSNERKLRITIAIRKVKDKGIPVVVDDYMKMLFSAKSFSANIPSIKMIKDVILANSPTSYCGSLLAVAGRQDMTNSLSKITIPSLILVGEYDEISPPSLSYFMHKMIPQSELYVIKDAGHMSNLENPQEFNQHLLDFLDKLND